MKGYKNVGLPKQKTVALNKGRNQNSSIWDRKKSMQSGKRHADGFQRTAGSWKKEAMENGGTEDRRNGARYRQKPLG